VADGHLHTVALASSWTVNAVPTPSATVLVAEHLLQRPAGAKLLAERPVAAQRLMQVP